MANATANLPRFPYGKEGRSILRDVDAGTHIYAGTMLAELNATGKLVPGTTAGSGPCVGVSEHEVDASADTTDGTHRAMFDTDCVYCFANGQGTDAVSETTAIGSPLYMVDDHTVADNDATGTRQLAGLFRGMEPDGKVRVFISPDHTTLAALLSA